MTSIIYCSRIIHHGGGKGGERMEQRLSRRAYTERECHIYIYTDT